MTSKDDVTLAAACLVAAEIVTAERMTKAGCRKMKVPAAKSRHAFWVKTLNEMAGLDPYFGDYRRGHGGVRFIWTIWAMSDAAASARPEDLAHLSPTEWDMAYEVTVTPSDVGLFAFGEEASDLGRGRYHVRQPHQDSYYPGLDGERGDHETPHVETHRRALRSVLDQIKSKIDVVADAARRRP